MKHEVPNPIEVAKRAFYLAWQACGGTLGRGFIQDRPGATEEAVWENVATAGDYSAKLRTGKQAYGDYVFGRMMKLGIEVGADCVTVADEEPRRDYQAWSGSRYPTYDALIEAAIRDLATEPTPAS